MGKQSEGPEMLVLDGIVIYLPVSKKNLQHLVAVYADYKIARYY
jgi:hypothetical protein